MYACELVACRYQLPFAPNPDRTYNSSPTRTIHIGVHRRYPPPGRSLLTRISSLLAVSLRVVGFQPTGMNVFLSVGVRTYRSCGSGSRLADAACGLGSRAIVTEAHRLQVL